MSEVDPTIACIGNPEKICPILAGLEKSKTKSIERNKSAFGRLRSKVFLRVSNLVLADWERGHLAPAGSCDAGPKNNKILPDTCGSSNIKLVPLEEIYDLKQELKGN